MFEFVDYFQFNLMGLITYIVFPVSLSTGIL